MENGLWSDLENRIHNLVNQLEGGAWCHLDLWRAQRRVLLSNGRKSRRGKSRSHVAWMAGGGGNVAF